MLIDSHVNLHAPAFDADRADVIDRARQAGIRIMVNICDRLTNLDAVRNVATGTSDIWHTVGTHPHEAKENPRLGADDLILAIEGSPRCVGVGECGLDHHYDLSPPDVQHAVFAAHIRAAQRTGLPLVVHTREADEEMAQMLEDAHAAAPFKLLLHCYTSGADLARRAAALGAWFSVSGIATFKAAGEVRAVIADMPENRIILETDCPYLAPIPMRGRRNEPSFLPHVAAKLAELRGWTLADTEARTADAFFALFDRIPRP